MLRDQTSGDESSISFWFWITLVFPCPCPYLLACHLPSGLHPVRTCKKLDFEWKGWYKNFNQKKRSGSGLWMTSSVRPGVLHCLVYTEQEASCLWGSSNSIGFHNCWLPVKILNKAKNIDSYKIYMDIGQRAWEGVGVFVSVCWDSYQTQAA